MIGDESTKLGRQARSAPGEQSLGAPDGPFTGQSEALWCEHIRPLRVALESLGCGVGVFDAQRHLLVWNNPFLHMYGIALERASNGCSYRDLLADLRTAGTFSGDPDAWDRELGAHLAQGRALSKTIELGDGRTILATEFPVEHGGFVGIHQDITAARKAERELDCTRAMLKTVIDHVPVALILKEAQELGYRFINRAGEELMGVPSQELTGKTVQDLFPEQEAKAIIENEREAGRERGQIVEQERPLRTPGNGTRIVKAKTLAIPDDHGRPQYFMTLLEDLTERKRLEAQLEHMRRHDALTSLPNRTVFNERLSFALERAAKMGERFAVLCMDCDRFKEINDVFGHQFGDALLREIAQRLHAAAPGNFLARLDGDEFGLIITEGPQPSTAAAVASRLLAVLAEEIDLLGERLRAGLSIGIALYPTDGAQLTTLLANAAAALFRAKTHGRGSVRLFEAEMDVKLRDRRALKHELRAAITNNELTLHYQPLATIDGTIGGFEALVRWRHPTRGLVSPTAFIPPAEESGLVVELGEWVLRQACTEAASWPRPLQIAVNLSPVQFRGGDLPGLVHTILLHTGLSASRLELEITESVLIGEFSQAIAVLRRLKALGVKIAMDDFGTGYSSLSYLQSFPFDKIKIDLSFIVTVDRNPHAAAIVRAVIGLARGLGVPVVAEGVQTEAQLAFLRREGCDEIQGYLVGLPRPIEEYGVLTGRAVEPTAKLLIPHPTLRRADRH
jgi:diguanylate cyclase (GGDEF)-like protein/PAS domain S-box-containing protein